MPYELHSSSDCCYPGTTCLINKFDIRNEKELSLVETGITVAKSSELMRNPMPGNFDFEHLKAIHKYLFGDLYEWAGEIRTINISKKRTKFVDAKSIERIARNCFQRLNEADFFMNLSFDDYTIQIADFYNTLNLIHPFREGNGRAQRCFMTQLIQKAGYSIDFSKIDSDELMIATIYAAQGINDLLINLFRGNLTELKMPNFDGGITLI